MADNLPKRFQIGSAYLVVYHLFVTSQHCIHNPAVFPTDRRPPVMGNVKIEGPGRCCRRRCIRAHACRRQTAPSRKFQGDDQLGMHRADRSARSAPGFNHPASPAGGYSDVARPTGRKLPHRARSLRFFTRRGQPRQSLGFGEVFLAAVSLPAGSSTRLASACAERVICSTAPVGYSTAAASGRSYTARYKIGGGYWGC
jgi:hypothetical protein